MPLFEIKHWLNGNVIHSIEADTLAKAVELLVVKGANLYGANLYGVGPAAAGALIALKSCPWMERVPDFYASNEVALADIKACAEKERELAGGAA